MYVHLTYMLSNRLVMSKTLKSYRFDQNTLDLIDDLRESLHLSNNSDVIRRALTLLKLAIDNQEKGGGNCTGNRRTD